MGITEYAFATYVFILLCIGMWLFGKFIRTANKKGSKKQEGDFEKEQRLFKLYQNIEDLLAGFEEFTEEARAETEKAKEEIREMLSEAKRICQTAQNASENKNDTFAKAAASETLPVITPPSSAALAAYKAAANIKMTEPETETAKGKHDTRESTSEPVKEHSTDNAVAVAVNGLSPIERLQLKIPDKVAEMSARGLDVSDIAQQLGISVREVSLAMKIRKVQ